ncbi:MAG: ATPase, T2SS/T4P/T4SS family [Kofleriaceae bacterium]
MFTIIIQEKGGEQRRMVFNKPEVTIGRVQGNDIVLPKGNVSKRHARIVLKDGKFIIVDLKSTNGTYVNGRKITSPLVVKDSDKIYIGDFIVGVDEASSGEGDGPSETTTSPPASERLPPPPAEIRAPRPTEAQPMPHMTPMASSDPLAASGPISSPPRGPQRPPPGPSREIVPRDPGPALGGPGGPGSIPPLAPPEPRARPMGRPGGTMPPPIAPISQMPAPVAAMPAPVPPQPMATHAEMGALSAPAQPAMPPAPRPEFVAPAPRPEPVAPAPLPAPAPIAAPVPTPAPAPVAAPLPAAGSAPLSGPAPVAPVAQVAPVAAGAPAPVVPLADKGKRNLVGVATRRVVGRSVSLPSRRGVQLEPLDPKVVKMLDLQSNILERLRAKLDLDKIPLERLHEEELWQRAERTTIDLVETLETSGELPKYIDQDSLIKETLSEALALGPLEELLADEKIDEIIIDRRDRVVVGKGGQLRASGKAFSSDEVFERVVKRLVAEAGARIDETHPLVDLRMRDGTRVTAAVSPVAARGACLVLKKVAPQMPQLSELVAQGALSSGMADFLATCITARRNILVCGGPGSGKTTVVAALAAASPAGERVVSIEEIAELAIARDEWIQLETRAGTGKDPAVDLGHLLDTALRLAPDRLIVGEVRGREAMPLATALCTSLDGAVVAMTGEGANAALNRLTTLARLSAPSANDGALRELAAQAFEIVLHVARWSDGTLRVMAIEEVVGITDTTFDTQQLFQFRDGNFAATGTVPRFYAELEARGIPADQAVFR